MDSRAGEGAKYHDPQQKRTPEEGKRKVNPASVRIGIDSEVNGSRSEYPENL